MELWKDIAGYEGLYQVSNYGHVKRLAYTQHYVDSNGHECNRHRKEHILKPAPMKCKKRSSGYLGVSLYNNHGSTTKAVHRLVAEAFVDNPHNLNQVNHKDEDVWNNRADNLEWCSCKYNINYGTANQRRSATHKRLKEVSLL